MIRVTADSFAGVVSQRIAAERLALAQSWLERVNEQLLVEPNEVFPSEQLLDHIPGLISEIAVYVRAPSDEEIAANAAVIDKARELGVLRHQQRASVHQLLREYEILGELLEQFVMDETARLGLHPSPRECFDVLQRMTRAVRTLMRTTVDTFVTEYIDTIQERNERIRSFNRMASHELRSPIGTLLFASALMDKPEVQQDPKHMVRIAGTVAANAERLSRLVTNLERLTRLADSVDLPTEQETDLNALCAEVARQLEDMAAARGVEIRVAPELPRVVVDAARLELIILNLVSNGIKYSDPSKSERFVEIGPAEEQPIDGGCAIAVRDNGLGVPDCDHATIFDRFVRVHAHMDDALGISGTGLGLAIVSECVRELGGTVDCQSRVKEGTTFLVRVPCRPPEASTAAEAGRE